MQAVGADRHAVPDNEANPGDAEHQSRHLAPGQRLSENRAVSRISGGQSVTAILPATKAKLHNRQNKPIYSGSALKPARGTVVEGARDIGVAPLQSDVGPDLDIWKLNDKLISSGISN